MVYHTPNLGLGLELGKKRVFNYEHGGKNWIIEVVLRDPEAEKKAQKEKDFEKRERAKTHK